MHSSKKRLVVLAVFGLLLGALLPPAIAQAVAAPSTHVRLASTSCIGMSKPTVSGSSDPPSSFAILFVNWFGSNYTNCWSASGSSPYLQNGTQGANYIESTSVSYNEGNFGFATLSTQYAIKSVVLYVEARSSPGENSESYVCSSGGFKYGTISTSGTSWADFKLNITGTALSTVSQINSLKIYFSQASVYQQYVDRTYLNVTLKGVYAGVKFANFIRSSQNQPSQTVTFHINCSTSLVTLNTYKVSTDNAKNWRTMTNINGTFSLSVTTENLSFTIILNSTGDRFIDVQVFACDSNNVWNASSIMTFFIWDSTTNAYSPRDRWGLLEYINETDAIMNLTFPYARGGSSSYTNYATIQLLDGVYLYLQTGNSMYLQGCQWVCQYFNTTMKAHLDYIWDGYNLTTSTFVSSSNPVFQQIEGLAIYASIVPQWRPLLQNVTNKWLSVYLTSSDNNFVGGSSVWTSDSQSGGIEFMSLVAYILQQQNVTLKNIAYSMITAWTSYDTSKGYVLPYERGWPGCKEDEGYANFMFALEEFYYFYPLNTTTYNFIKTYASNSAYMWNSTLANEEHWNYYTCFNGTNEHDGVGNVLAVHGFGMTDEAVCNAYLICVNAGYINVTWKNHAIQDWKTLVGYPNLNGAIIYNGTVAHATDFSGHYETQSEDMWAVYARRFGMELYDISGNASYLKLSSQLFWNFTMKSQRSLGIQTEIQLTTGTDYSSDPNDRDTVASYVIYRNITTSTYITTFPKMVQTFGLPTIGMIPNGVTITLSAPVNNKATTSLVVTFNYTVSYFGIAPKNASLWINNQKKASNSTPISVSGTNSITYNLSSHGVYTWVIASTDGNYWYTAPSNYTLIDPPISISPSSVTLDVGQSQTFSSTVTGSPAYQWYENVSSSTYSAISEATSSSFTFTFSAWGRYNIYLNCSYSGTYVVSNTAAVTVNYAPRATISASPVATTMDINQNKLFTATASNGTSPYRYCWYLNGSLKQNSTSTTWTFTPSFAGSYAIYVNATDSTGTTVKSNVTQITVTTVICLVYLRIMFYLRTEAPSGWFRPWGWRLPIPV